MSSDPLVSVRIPSYNHEPYVRDCISSILGQTYQNFEIVITDDGSVDGTVDAIREFQDPRIRLEVLDRNSGMNVASAHCVARCRGTYIANLCSDDMWEPAKLETQVRFLQSHPEYDAVFTKAAFIGETGRVLAESENRQARIFNCENREPAAWLRRFFLDGNCLCCPSVLIKREVYQALGCQDKRMISLSDFDLWVRFLLAGYRFWILEDTLTRFRIRDRDMNLSADTPENRNRCAFEYKQILDNFLVIRDPELLAEAFPECRQFGEPKADTIPYFLGRLAARGDTAFARLWGCETIFRLLSDPAAAARLETLYDFRYNDFYTLTKTTDFFHLLHTGHINGAGESCKKILWRVSPRLYQAARTVYRRIKGKDS